MVLLIEIPQVVDAMCLIRCQRFPDAPLCTTQLEPYTRSCLDAYLRASVGMEHVPYELSTEPFDQPIRNLIADGLKDVYTIYPHISIRHIEAVDTLGTVLITR